MFDEATEWMTNSAIFNWNEKTKKAATIGDKSLVQFSAKDPKDVNMPNQYAKVKSVAKGEEMVEENRAVLWLCWWISWRST